MCQCLYRKSLCVMYKCVKVQETLQLYVFFGPNPNPLFFLLVSGDKRKGVVQGGEPAMQWEGRNGDGWTGQMHYYIILVASICSSARLFLVVQRGGRWPRCWMPSGKGGPDCRSLGYWPLSWGKTLGNHMSPERVNCFVPLLFMVSLNVILNRILVFSKLF